MSSFPRVQSDTTFLDGVKVLDLTRILAGPWATQNLSDLGADVIKIERPLVGDDTRRMGPPFLSDTEGKQGDAAYFMCCNRGKKSVTIDITKSSGQDLIRQLVINTDVFVENYKVGDLKRYGLDYAELSRIKPDIIYCSITGFGQYGPYSKRAGYDYLIQAMGGLMSITGERDGLPGAGPQKVGLAVADLLSGMYATVAILAALRRRDHGYPHGQYIDISMLDCQVSVLANQAMNFLATGTSPKRLGTSHPNVVPYQTYHAKDGYLVLAIGNDLQFSRFCNAIGQAELAADPRFSTNKNRVTNRDELEVLIQRIMLDRSVNQWVKLLEEAQVPCGPINNLEQVFNDPHVQTRGMRRELAHQRYGQVPSVRNPIVVNGEPLDNAVPPPVLGQDTACVLRQTGVSDTMFELLRRQGVV